MALPAEIVQHNLKAVLEHIKLAAQRLNVSPPRLVAVGKTFPADATETCYNAGQRHFGENYIQELEEKAAQLASKCPEINWHYIGRVQVKSIQSCLFYKSNRYFYNSLLLVKQGTLQIEHNQFFSTMFRSRKSVQSQICGALRRLRAKNIVKSLRSVFPN